MKSNISLEEAQQELLDLCQVLPGEKVLITDGLNRVLYGDLRAPENIPPFARSAYDGYAFKAADTQQASKEEPVILRVLEEIPAGYAPTKKVIAGTATKVMTGAPIPEGADAVIQYELTERTGDELRLFFPCQSGDNIAPAGEDVGMGELVLPKGTEITPPVVGLLASLGIAEVPVFRRPRIAVVSTGDELIGIEEPLKPAKIRNSNAYSLHAYIQGLGATPLLAGTARDRVDEVGDYINRALDRADMVVTTGGVSVGDYDVMADALKGIGAELVLWQIDIKPGSPTLAAYKDGKIILCLSGNPASALVVFQLLGAPLVKKMAGHQSWLPEKVEAVLLDEFTKDSPKRRFLRGTLYLENGSAVVKLTGDQGNAVLRSMIGCNILVEVPGGSGPLQKGTKLTAHLVDKIEQVVR